MVSEPEHIAVFAPAEAAGSGFTVIVTEFEALQPFALVSVTVYFVVTVGATVGLEEADE